MPEGFKRKRRNPFNRIESRTEAVRFIRVTALMHLIFLASVLLGPISDAERYAKAAFTVGVALWLLATYSRAAAVLLLLLFAWEALHALLVSGILGPSTLVHLFLVYLNVRAVEASFRLAGRLRAELVRVG